MNKTNEYRNDIDGLRAIAVLAAILFHLGICQNGYLGVDVFFVISGYLITLIIYTALEQDRFSIIDFYLRRIRRIIPLTLFITMISLIIGIFTMLPDSLENLAQSIVATNLFSNNILQAITTSNYWDIVNEYKPLMHTWSLGIEEQYYLFYPLLLMFIGKKHKKWLLPILSFLTVISFALFLSNFQEFQKFYLIPFRFYELSVGGIMAIYLKGRLVKPKLSVLFMLALLYILFFNYPPNTPILLPITVLLTLGIIVSSNSKNKLLSSVLTNPLMTYIGKISFSLYMWHQPILAYTRYCFVQELEFKHIALVSFITLIIAIFSYHFLEQPFRNKNKIKTKPMLITLTLFFITINSFAFYIHLKSGVLKDFPELDLQKENVIRNIHGKYNSRIYGYDKSFTKSNKIHVLIIGDSFARDWANVLLESNIRNKIEISYFYKLHNKVELGKRANKANVIFFASATATTKEINQLEINNDKLFVVGTKNFGSNIGIYYNYRGKNYYRQRAKITKSYIQKDKLMSSEWNTNYISYINSVIDNNKTAPVFTPSKKIISQDCRHLTKAGAKYFAEIFRKKLFIIFNKNKI